MQSFKIYFRPFIEHITLEPSPRLLYLWEMARKVEDRIPIFDEDDQAYYGYIVNNLPDELKDWKTSDDPHKREYVVKTLMQALAARYGRQSNGAGATHGQLLDLADAGRDHFDLNVSIGASKTTKLPPKKFTIKNVPMFPNRVIAKVDAAGYVVDSYFGYGSGSLGATATGVAKATDYYEFFRSGGTHQVSASGGTLDARSNAHKKDSSDDSRAAYGASVEAGSGSLPQAPSNADISKTPVPLDDQDDRYLQSVLDGWHEHLRDMDEGGALFARVADEVRAKVSDDAVRLHALMLRYSDYFVKKNEDGEFEPAPHFAGKGNGDMQGNIVIETLKLPPRGTPLHLSNVYINVPHLVQKFEKYKKTKDFVSNPLTKGLGRQVADRWLKSRSYNPNSRFRSRNSDIPFFNQMGKDHDVWREQGALDADTLQMYDVEGEPISDRNLLRKVKQSGGGWRDEDGIRIVEPPNIANEAMTKSRKKPIESMSWSEVLQEDAIIGIYGTIDLLARTLYAGDKGFLEWARKPEVMEELKQQVFLELMNNHSGEDGFRSEAKRIRWANNASNYYIVKMRKSAAKGGAADPDKGPDVFDTAPSKEAIPGGGGNTLKPSNRINDDEPDHTGGLTGGDVPDVQDDYVDDEHDDHPDRLSDEQVEEMMQQAAVARAREESQLARRQQASQFQLPQGVTLRRPPAVKITDWMMMKNNPRGQYELMRQHDPSLPQL